MRKIGFMGGTFNPIHVGHLLLAQWAYETFELDEVLVIPTGISYLKAGTGVASGEDRMAMCRLATSDIPYMHCSDIELVREGYTYTYETLIELEERYPDSELYFICGADCLFSIEKWKKPEEILKRCILTAAVRADSSIEVMEQKRKELSERYDCDIRLLPFLQMDISSTVIRERQREGKSIRFLVTEPVRQYIEDKKLYGNE